LRFEIDSISKKFYKTGLGLSLSTWPKAEAAKVQKDLLLKDLIIKKKLLILFPISSIQ
jgi:hypothetical protein